MTRKLTQAQADHIIMLIELMQATGQATDVWDPNLNVPHLVKYWADIHHDKTAIRGYLVEGTVIREDILAVLIAYFKENPID